MLNYIVICIYFAFLIGVSFVFSKKVSTGEDYFKAGAQGTWWLVGVSMFMSGISSYTFVGNAAGIYLSGWSPIVLYLANVISLVICGFGLAAIYRQMRVVTVAEVVRIRFGKTTEQIIGMMVVVNSLIWSGVILYGLSIFSKMLFPELPNEYVIIIVGSIVLSYCSIGGSWAVMANDFIQGLVLIGMTILLTILCFYESGGISEFFTAINEQPTLQSNFSIITASTTGDDFWSQKYGLTWCIASFITQFLVMTGLFQGVRYFSAKEGKTANQSSFLGGALMIVGCIVFFIPPMYARLYLEPEVMAMSADALKAPEFSYAVTSRELLPNGLFSIMIVAMFSAAVSSMDTGLNRNAALLVRDIIPTILGFFTGHKTTIKNQVLAGRICTFGCGLFIVLLALLYNSIKELTIFDLMLNIVAMFLTPQMVPLILFLFIKKTAPWAALLSIICGFLPSIANLIFDFGWSYQVKTFIILFSSIFGYFIAIPFYAQSSEAYKTQINDFYQQMKTPVQFTNEVKESSDQFQMIVIGRFGLLLSALLAFLLVLPNESWARISILGLATFIASISSLLIITGKRLKDIS